MSKRLKLLKIAKPSYILILAAVSCLICLNALRTNNLEMVKLRADVYQADKDNKDVRGALTTLQHYVTSHMNTNLTPGPNTVYPPIQLKYTYDRLQAALDANQQTNDQVYSDAQAYCEAQNSSDFSGRNRVPCIQQYVLSHGATAPKTVPDGLYKFDFLSPTWSPDLAGWTVITTLVLGLLAVVVWIVRRVYRSRIS